LEVLLIGYDVQRQAFDFFQIINPDAKSDWNDDAGIELEVGRSFLEAPPTLNAVEFFQSIEVSTVGPLDHSIGD